MDEDHLDNSAIEALPPLKDLVASLDMRARKSLGQNFLFDLNLTRRIARSAASLNGTTIEVGPGPGGLTRALLLEGAENVIAVEKDFRAATVLDSLLTAAGDRLRLVEGDALKTPLWEMGSAPRRIVANLPYNIATPLIVDLLNGVPAISRMLVMVQLEAAQRFAAGPGSTQYGAVSVRVAHRAHAQIVGKVPASVFLPRPKVESALVELVRREAVRTVDEELFDRLLRAGFGQRRKMLRRSLAGLVGEATMAAAGVEPTARPETLSLDEWYALTDAVGSS